MPYITIRHKVKDYDTWKPEFDAHGPIRSAAGCKGGHLLRGIDDRNEVVIFFEWDTLENARKFAASPDLKATMEEAGVIDQPDVYFLENQASLTQ